MFHHFLDIADFEQAVLKNFLHDAVAMKGGVKPHASALANKVVAMIFEKPSTRTRVSFEVGIIQLGGSPLVMQSNEMQLGRGETVADTARVLSGYIDAMMIRTSRHEILLELAAHASVPVINGLTDRSHPCQVMADVMTIAELKAPDYDFGGLKVAWCGDGNNVATSWIEAASRFEFELVIATPSALGPSDDVIAMANPAYVTLMNDIEEAVEGADVVVTDTWSSMGMPGGYSNSGDRQELLRAYQVDASIMSLAKSDAIFMHCLPVYRGQEATADVVDGKQSVIWQEAQNRLHVQKAIMNYCINGGS